MSNNPKLIGVTGGIGAGKSTVCKILEVLGHKVYYADDRGKWLMNYDYSLKKEIRLLFGSKAYVRDQLNRKYIGDLVFKSPELLEKLNALVHPAVARDLIHWISKNNNEKILFYEAALLFETGSYEKMDFNILVTSPEKIRMDRVVKRDHRTVSTFKEIISRQMADEVKMPLADFVIQNDGSQSVIKQIMSLYKRSPLF